MRKSQGKYAKALVPLQVRKNSAAQHAKALMLFQEKARINYACQIRTWILQVNFVSYEQVLEQRILDQ